MTRKNSKVLEQEPFDILDRDLPKRAYAVDSILRVRRVEWSFAVRCERAVRLGQHPIPWHCRRESTPLF